MEDEFDIDNVIKFFVKQAEEENDLFASQTASWLKELIFYREKLAKIADACWDEELCNDDAIEYVRRLI